MQRESHGVGENSRGRYFRGHGETVLSKTVLFCHKRMFYDRKAKRDGPGGELSMRCWLAQSRVSHSHFLVTAKKIQVNIILEFMHSIIITV